MESVKINQKEYLKKYLSSGGKKEKKKKKAVRVGPKKVKIIDDDIDLNNLRPMEDGEFDIFNSTEDAPQIAGIVDERGPVVFTDKRRWKIIADDGEGNIAITSNNNRQESIHNQNNSHDTTKEYSKKSSTKSKEKNHNYSDDEQTIPRKTDKRKPPVDDDLSPPRKSSRPKKHQRRSSSSDSNSSSSTRRKSKKRSSKPEKSTKYDSDLSPPRISKKHSDSQREFRDSRRQDADSDLSPPRISKKHSDSQRESRDSRRQDADSDLSPPRISKKHSDSQREFRDSRRQDADSDLSPPRKLHRDSHRRDRERDDRRTRHDSNKNFNVSRRDRERSPRHRKSRWGDESRRSQSPQVDRRLKKTLDGKTAGLQDAVALREETASYKKREAEFFNKMSAEVSGVGQATILRDRKTGRRRNLEAEAAEKREKEKRQEEIDMKYAKWGKGLKQSDDQAEKLKQDLYEMSKPLARYADDADLDAQLRAVEREGDPMLAYIKQKQIKEGKREPDKPNYQGSFMPNRFGIKPGHRWDGVDRSNGYEKKWFEMQNARTATQEEAYKWSTSDM